MAMDAIALEESLPVTLLDILMCQLLNWELVWLFRF